MWSDMKKKAMSRCFLCEAGPKELAKRRGKFKIKGHRCKFGIASLHARKSAFQWVCKAFLYADVKAYARNNVLDPEIDDKIKDRLKELQRRFKQRLNLEVYQVLPGTNQISFTLKFVAF